MTSLKLNRRSWLLLFLVVIVVCSILPAGIIFDIFYLPDLSLRQAIKPYPQASFLFEDMADVNTGEVEYTDFYWTSDARDTVENYYESALSSAFVEANISDDWIITSYQLNGVKPTANPESYPATHNALCSPGVPHDSDAFQCISISLVRASQAALCRLPIVSSGDGFAVQPTPYEKCSLIPTTGTLIIYKFHEDSM